MCVVHVLLCIPEHGALKWYVQVKVCVRIGLVMVCVCICMCTV